MGTIQQSFNQAITGATFLLQQTPVYAERREAYLLRRRLKTGTATENDITNALSTKEGESGGKSITAKNQRLSLNLGLRRGIEEINEEMEQDAREHAEAEFTRLINQKAAQDEYHRRLRAQILNPQNNILSPEEIKNGRLK